MTLYIHELISPSHPPWEKVLLLSQLTDEEIEAQRGYETGTRSHSQYIVGSGFKSRQLDTRVEVLSFLVTQSLGVY